ncbi:hypothetical protein BUALT_Bualt09G0086500 [Buddleja alternifolia]|uniref:AT-hook motif nuclear-localized protein n=1 Tax=Buddleja alternifolia TaxID=168488 RepID=A0AAV6XBU4_9LAMI|nr:hypothetical protein BUALT_Bualt09G0086500 [Buddleja alternifolia]
MEMEDKESTESGSPLGNSDVDSPPSIGGAYGGGHGGGGFLPGNINMNMSVEKNAGVTTNTNPPAVLPDGAVNGGVMGGGGIIGGDGGGAIAVSGGSGELSMGKKKRGRPRKYDADGKLSELFATTAGGDFTPHVVTVHTGEDVAGKILTFAQKGHRGICVLSANGSVSNVTIRQPGSSGGLGRVRSMIKHVDLGLVWLLDIVGRFEILTLTGSFTISDSGGIKSRSGGLSVSLASSDGRVIGGGVAGMLIAATPIQIVVGSFVPNGFKTHKKPRISHAVHCAPATVTAAVPISQAAPERNIYTMPPVQNLGEADNSLSNKDHPNSASTDSADWNDSGPSPDQRPSPDINISVPVEEH